MTGIVPDYITFVEEVRPMRVPTSRASMRVTDHRIHGQGATVVCRTQFDILPVDFASVQSRSGRIFSCVSTVGPSTGNDFSFRKCYARGCPHNLCPHVSQAVLIANRYLQRDYHRLKTAGIAVEKNLFSLEEMVLKFDQQKEDDRPGHGAIRLCPTGPTGQEVTIRPTLDFVSAVEHFDRFENKMIFFMADFAVTCQGETTHHGTLPGLLSRRQGSRGAVRPRSILANARLRLLYEELVSAGGKAEKSFFV
jgi:hypothetical protein